MQVRFEEARNVFIIPTFSLWPRQKKKGIGNSELGMVIDERRLKAVD
jgi:hypothetical protein